ncbi:VOC family protein [Umezawaea tangerina]|uniref:Glyoxalase/bleomycin resistance protein/dioxygenase superfamily protein n=1 Tax=Umezawaea tangerina TaxID=84725 RepID=A0A2T0TG74_9PSEU|nr:VOC family protein [Umezawaea tangerina]PRY44670.1 glyoxalase/bleomycin resistance protein/dioxygenase superfamily protein [Umezawaea tangerina]
MPLHRLTSITMGVPNVAETAAYYAEFGLQPTTGGTTFSTVDGGEQLRVADSARRRLLELGVGADDPDDLDRVATDLERLGFPVTRTAMSVSTLDPGTGTRVEVAIASRLVQPEVPAPRYNGPGRHDRVGARADGVLRTDRVRPRKLGHVVLGSTDVETSQRLFTEGLGFKVSDTVRGLAAFLRCSTDHHNVLVQQAPLQFLHHTSWQVDDVDEVGRGASSMLAADPGRHVWGLGRHHVGSNFFWYLRDPAGNFSEYYSDLDCIVDDALWKPGVWEGVHGLYNWGPPPPPSFLAPEDLAALMTGAHSD